MGIEASKVTYKFVKYHLIISSRPNSTESVEAKHEKLMFHLLSLGTPWGINEIPHVEPKKLKREGVSLSRFLGKGIQGLAGYSGRVLHDDSAVNDDSLILKFNAEKVPYNLLLEKALKIYIESFSVYRIDCIHEDFYLWNEDDIEKEPLLTSDPRHGVDSFGPINFFDEMLCQRAFNMTCRELQSSLDNSVAHSELFEEGLLIYLSLVPMTLEEIKASNEIIRDKLSIY